MEEEISVLLYVCAVSVGRINSFEGFINISRCLYLQRLWIFLFWLRNISGRLGIL
jgi:hypothetical protein